MQKTLEKTNEVSDIYDVIAMMYEDVEVLKLRANEIMNSLADESSKTYCYNRYYSAIGQINRAIEDAESDEGIASV